MGVGSVSMSGLVSELDTDSIVSSLMSVARSSVNQMTSQQDTLEIKKVKWQTFNTYLSSLKDAISGINSSSEFKSMSATSSDSDKVSASVTGTALAGTYKVKVTQLANAQTSVSSTTFDSGTSAFSSDLNPTIRFSINGGAAVNVNLTTNTLDGAIAAINAKDMGIYAYKVQREDGKYQLALSGENTGADYDFTITPPTGVAFTTPTTAQDTLAKVNGIDVRSASREITGAIPGISLTASQETGETELDITVSTDVEGIKDNIQTFVDSYNVVMKFVKDQLSYDADSESAGPLASDNTLRDIQRSLQSLVRGEYTSNDVSSLSMLGVKTKSDGSLEVDADELTSALEDHFSEVVDFFTSSTGIFNAFTNVTKAGRLDFILDTTEGTIQSRLDSLDEQIATLTDQIDREDTRLTSMEENLKEKFSAMEVALSKLSMSKFYVENVLAKKSSS